MVGTHADRVQRRAERQWIERLTSGSIETTHGYFAARLSAPEEREQRIIWDKARDIEMKFFQNAPWKDVPEQRLGVFNLAKHLSRELCSMIQRKYSPHQY